MNVTGHIVGQLDPGDSWRDWNGIKRDMSGNHDKEVLVAFDEDGKAVSWIAYSFAEIGEELYISMFSAYTLPESRSNGYFQAIFDKISKAYPTLTILGNWANKKLANRVRAYNMTIKETGAHVK